MAFTHSSVPGMTLRQAFKSRSMLLIIIAQAFFVFTVKVVMIHVVPYATDVGITSSTGALAVSTIGGFGIAGRLVMGLAQDKIGPRHAMILCSILQGISLLALPLIRTDFLFFAFGALFGITYGGEVPQLPALSAQFFGLASLTVIYGAEATIGNLLGAFGPVAAGYIFDVTKSYTFIFVGAAALMFTGAACIWRLKGSTRNVRAGLATGRSPTIT